MSSTSKIRTRCTLLLIATAAIVLFQLNRPESSAATQSTDDAYVQADFTVVAPQISGTVAQVFVEDNQPVQQGALLATIDDRSFVVAVEASQALVAGARANITGLQARLQQQESVILQARALVAADEAALKLATDNEVRYRNLAADGSGTVQALQQAEAQLLIQRATLEKDRAGLQLALQQSGILQADIEKAVAALAQAEAAQAAAELQLSYTRISAPISGTTGQRSLRVGAFVTAGKPLLALVPLDAVYIDANFRETQVAHMQAGQRVDIEVDALPGILLEGSVESIGPASGVSYSAIAPHNATGNFTKIVQRLPVRISIDAGQSAVARLRVGMSVTPRVYTGK